MSERILETGDPIPERWIELARDWRFSDEFVGSVIRRALGGPDYDFHTKSVAGSDDAYPEMLRAEQGAS